jgi:Flp pilus assembly protein TadD
VHNPFSRADDRTIVNQRDRRDDDHEPKRRGRATDAGRRASTGGTRKGAGGPKGGGRKGGAGRTTAGDAGASAGRRSGSARTSSGARKATSARRTGDDRGGRKQRTSRSSDERNPTRSGTQYPPKRYRARDRDDSAPRAPVPDRPVLRTVRRGAGSTRDRARDATRRRTTPVRRRRGRSTEAMAELASVAGRNARRAQDQLARAADAFAEGRERDAARLLRPLRDAYPDASAVRELLGLSHYRLGQYPAATKELEAFVDLSDSVEQHPVLMDCHRAAGRYDRVDVLWQELAAASPSATLVTEGRIVYAGALADRGRLRDAITVLEKRAADVKRVQEHHLRLWYALADLYERAGDIPGARMLFERVRRHDNGFADVGERLLALR